MGIVISADHSENSFVIEKLNPKPILSETLLPTNNQKTADECCNVNVENIADHDNVSFEVTNQLKHDFPDGNSQNLPDKCLITQRLNQYLRNVVSNDHDLELSGRECRTSAKQSLNKKNRSRRISQKNDERSCSTENKRNFSRQKPRQFHSRNRQKYSRKHYWEEFEDFRHKLDDDVRHKLQENYKETEKVQDNLQETFDGHEICNKAKRETTDQFILRIRPKSRHGSRSPKVPHSGYTTHSKKRSSRKPLELNAVSKSKNTESSFWTFL